jgi:hypothetical protein
MTGEFMINEVFDDEATTDIVEPETPKGDFSRTFNDLVVWFHNPTPAKAVAFERLKSALYKQFGKVKKMGSTPEAYQAALQISIEFDELCIDYVEALMVDREQAKELNRQILRGELTIQAMMETFFERAEPADDEAPVRKATKKTANAKRTRK